MNDKRTYPGKKKTVPLDYRKKTICRCPSKPPPQPLGSVSRRDGLQKCDYFMLVPSSRILVFVKNLKLIVLLVFDSSTEDKF